MILNKPPVFETINNIASMRLLGRHAASRGAAQEISLGSGLYLNQNTGVLSVSVSNSVYWNDILNKPGPALLTAYYGDVAQGRLVGRRSDLGTGPAQEIIIGAGLSLIGDTLSASGGSVDYPLSLANGGTGANISSSASGIVIKQSGANAMSLVGGSGAIYGNSIVFGNGYLLPPISNPGNRIFILTLDNGGIVWRGTNELASYMS
jgi:hypothetical protein